MAAPLRIAITGAAGTGKTTLLGRLARLLPDVPALPEAARRLIEEGGVAPKDMDPERRAAFQSEVLRRQTEAETAHASFVSDGCVLDTLAYARAMPHYPRLLARAREHLAVRPYTHVALLPRTSPVADDGVRTLDEDYRKTVEERLLAVLEELGIPFRILTGGDPDARAAEILALVA